MTAHPIDTEALRRLADDHRAMDHDPTADALTELLDALAAAEHRATRAEAQSAIRGRAVTIHRGRAREAEQMAGLWKECARQHIEGERFAEAHIDKWRQWGERLHETHMAEVRDREARITAVRAVADGWAHPVDAVSPGVRLITLSASAAIYRALGSTTAPTETER